MIIRNQVQRGVASVNIVTTGFNEITANIIRTVGSVHIKQIQIIINR